MLCGNCFEELNNETVCPGCGYDNTATGKYPLALVSNTILNGRYITGRILGQGGFGITYLAYDHTAKDKVAIKEYFPTELATRIAGTCTVMPVSESAEEAYSSGHESFLNEAKTLARFRESKNIVCVHRYFEENGTAYLVMEYVEGIGLDKYMAARGGRLAPEKANALLMPLMDALYLVHQKGVVHRDIAPDNIIVTADDTAKLIDFGAARYSTGEKSKSLDVILKHGFAPIEQYTRHSRQGPYTDVYAFSATYYYAVTGRIMPDAAERMVEDTFTMPSQFCSIWSELENALLKGLSIKPQDRYQSMAEMRSAFDAAIEAENERKSAAKKAEEARLAAEKAAEERRLEKERKQQQKKLEEEQRKAALKEAAEERARKTVEKRLEKTKKKELRREIKEKKTEAEETEKKVPSFKLSKKLIIGLIAAVVCIVAVCVSLPTIKQNIAYSDAEKLYESGQYEEAIADNIENITEKETEDVSTEIVPLNEAIVGSIVKFGTYEQDNDKSNGKEDIEWLVLAKEDNKMLVISEKALDCQQFNHGWDSFTWDGCSLRRWLNDSFLNDAFNSTEQMLVQETNVNADNNPNYSTDAGNDTNDKVFILSISEANEYFSSEEDRKCFPTAYAYANGLDSNDVNNLGKKSTSCWWLRSPGSFRRNASSVLSDGAINYSGYDVMRKNCFVRPAMWISIDNTESITEKESEDFSTEIVPLNEATVGSMVEFGAYEQDNDASNGKEKIEWQVLDKQDDKILIISKYTLDCQPYNTSYDDVTWETCTLRTWMNNDFVNNALSEEEQRMISTTNVVADKNPEYESDFYGINPGNATMDKVFLLSVKETEKYFISDRERICETTEYALSKGAGTSKSGNCWWWLRTPGSDQGSASGINYNGSISYGGGLVSTKFGCVRPAMWLSIE